MLKVDRTTTAKAIKKLVESDYIIKKNDVEDKRSFKLYPSERSIGIYSFLCGEEKFSTDSSLKGFSDEEKEILHNLLERMRKILKRIGKL
ncbi:hypothetical protein JTS93_01285 [Clostridium botulinum]|nr:hypothetical protein [Clostridium botulinum]